MQRQAEQGMRVFTSIYGQALASVVLNLPLLTEVFLRRNLGSRRLGIVSFVAAVAILQATVFWPAANGATHRWEPSTAFKAFFLAFLAMCFWQWMVMAIRRSRGVRSHGDSIGDSRLESVLPIRRLPAWIQLVIDPVLAFTAGAATHSTDPRLSFLLKASAVAMLCIRVFAYSHYRAGIREAVEHQLESEQLVQDIATELQPPLPPPRTHPSAAPAEVFISPNVAAGRPETAGLFERLHPKYRELLEEKQEPPAGS